MQHHLTHENYKLIRILRQKRKEGFIKFVWLQNNTLVAKMSENSKIIQIKTQQDILQFIDLTNIPSSSQNSRDQKSTKITK